ncbi:MAG TPA: hypothetical protein VG253_25000 [Streptosporangiaceae bacterium]|nr:hypothetical protein [Streptosporangiaceae bacterium]
MNDDSSPLERYRAALLFLNAHMPRRAEILIRDAVKAGFVADLPKEGFTANHVAYHWLLAVLSGRSYEQLSPNDFAAIKRAKGLAARDKPDSWEAALNLILSLLATLKFQEITGGTLYADSSKPLQQYLELSVKCREDFQRHLDVILEAGRQHELVAVMAEQEADRNRRMSSSNRARRAWKFFEPVPEPPRPKVIPAPPEPTLSSWIFCGIGLTAGFTGLVWALFVVSTISALRAAVLLLLLSGAGFALFRYGKEWLAEKGRLADREYEHGYQAHSRYAISATGTQRPWPEAENAGVTQAEDPERGASLERFELETSTYIDAEFAIRTPKSVADRRAWLTDMKSLKTALKNDIHAAFRSPETKSGGVNWLIRWRIREIATQWQHRTLYDYRHPDRSSRMARLVPAISLGALGALALVTIEACTVQIGPGLISVTLVALAYPLLMLSRLDVYAVRKHRLPADRTDAEKRLKAEATEYDRWRDVLSNRPDEYEMGSWLDYDQRHIMTLATKRMGLSPREILTRAVVVEAAPGCDAARIVYGPARYSAYIITVFLLTESGVRYLSVPLNFLSGVLSEHVRASFSYDAITSVRVREIAVPFDRADRTGTARVAKAQNNGGKPVYWLKDTLLKSAQNSAAQHEFQLVLASGQKIRVSVENFDWGLRDEELEDSRKLLDLALDTSGVANALLIMEAVAGQGKDWLTKERPRRQSLVPNFPPPTPQPPALLALSAPHASIALPSPPPPVPPRGVLALLAPFPSPPSPPSPALANGKRPAGSEGPEGPEAPSPGGRDESTITPR